MNVVKMIGMIFLAAYLIANGLAQMAEVTMSPMAMNWINLMGIASGILILVSIGRFLPHGKGR